MTFLTAGPNLPFTVALLLMLAIAVLEGVALLLGLGFASMLDSLIPDIDFEVPQVELDGAQAPTGLSRLLGWLHVGEVPMLVLLIAWLTAFGLSGLAIQSVATNTFGVLMPALPASVAAAAVSLPVVGVLAKGLARVLPRDETTAVSHASFVGRVATITLGTARLGSPAEARLTDKYDQTHYVMVMPDVPEVEFKKGEQVLLVKKDGARFRAIPNPSDALVD